MNQLPECLQEFQGRNPYIHGTTSKILNILPLTEFKMMDPVDMVAEYGVAPLSGELIRGGLDNIKNKCRTRFGRMTDCHYDYNSVKSYTEIRPYRDNDLSILNSHLKTCASNAFHRIKILLVYMVRCRSRGIELSQLIDKNLADDMRKIKNALAITLFFDIFLNVNPEITFDKNTTMDKSEKMRKYEQHRDIIDAIYTHFTLDYFANKCKHLDLLSIYLRLVNDNKSFNDEFPEKDELLDILTLPKTSIVQRSYGKKVELTIDITQPFIFTEPHYKERRDRHTPGYFQYQLSANNSSYSLDVYMTTLINKECTKDFYRTFRESMLEYIRDFGKHIDLFEYLINNVDQIKNVGDIHGEFPLIFISNDSTLFNAYSSEYQAVKDLKIGNDISIIATDTNEHKEYLEKYFSQYNLHIDVVLFQELELL